MMTDIHDVLQNMPSLQAQLEAAFDEAREKFRCTLQDGRIRIAAEVSEFQRNYRVGSLRYLLNADLGSLLTAPFIYSMIIPLVIIDATFTLYQQVCFRAYGIPRVRRLAYLVNDRHKLGYLNTIEKANCAYCGYASGVVAYVREILSVTEQYWCPVRHAHRVLSAHERYPEFFSYGDAQRYQQGLQGKRSDLRQPGAEQFPDEGAS